MKRRSVRGTSSRQSRRSDRGGGNDRSTTVPQNGTHRSSTRSTRSSRRKVHHVNPVTKLMDQQNSFPSFKHTNSNLTENNLKTLNNDYILNNQYHHQNPKKDIIPSKSTPALNSFAQKQSNELTSAAMNRHTPTDPIYYNMNVSSPLIVQQTSWNETSTPSPQAYATNHFHHHHQTRNEYSDAATSLGHTNLTYVHSNPSLVDGEMNEYYQTNRPPSVHSSYSNFHGTRPLSYNPNPSGSRERDKENLFANLSQQQHQNRPHTLYQSSQPQAIPQVPQKKGAGSRDRFMNNAPPAYHPYNHHTPPDSETTM